MKMRWQTIASSVSMRTISPTATPLPTAYDCVAVYIAGRRTNLVVYGCRPKPTTKNSSTAYIILYKWIDTWFLDSNRRVGVWSLLHGAGTSSPSHWQQVEEQAPKPVGWTMCFLLMTLVPVQKLCVNIYVYVYMYVHSLYEFCYRSYIQRECHSVLAKLHPITFYRIISGECAVPGLNATFCFLWFTNCVLLFDKGLILGCLWPLVFVLNNILILGIWCSTIPHLPGCFCPWTFFENIGFNTVLANPFMSHLATQLGYSAGEFQALQLIVLAAFGVVD